MQFLAVMAGGALLIWPAILNTYPILFSDTGGLLEMGLVPSIGWDKPFVYGPLIAALSLRTTLWFPVAAQGVLLSYILWVTQRAFGATVAWRHLTLCLVLAAGTGAPWFASTLMPDLFTPVVALGLIAASCALPGAHRLAVIVITAVAIAAHLAHLILAVAVIATLLVLNRRIPWSALTSLAAAILFLLGSNVVGHGRLAISPYGSVFALARLIADGPARDYLARACPEAGYELCAWQDQLTSDSDQFLWDAKSPFWADPMPLPAFAAQASQIVTATIRAYPLRVLRDAYRNTAHQLIRVSLGDTLGPNYLADAVRPRIERWFPAAELRRFDHSRQQSGALAVRAARLLPIQRALLMLGALATTLILMAGLQAPSPRADLAALVMIALMANAIPTGALSTVHDRYEARLAWIVLLPSLLYCQPQARRRRPATFAIPPRHD